LVNDRDSDLSLCLGRENRLAANCDISLLVARMSGAMARPQNFRRGECRRRTER
jgi:hypothetical protein